MNVSKLGTEVLNVSKMKELNGGFAPVAQATLMTVKVAGGFGMKAIIWGVAAIWTLGLPAPLVFLGIKSN